MDAHELIERYYREVSSERQLSTGIQEGLERPAPAGTAFAQSCQLFVCVQLEVLALHGRNNAHLRESRNIVRIYELDVLDSIYKSVLPVHFQRFFVCVETHSYRAVADAMDTYREARSIGRQHTCFQVFLSCQRNTFAQAVRFVCVRLQHQCCVCGSNPVQEALQPNDLECRRVEFLLPFFSDRVISVSQKFCIHVYSACELSLVGHIFKYAVSLINIVFIVVSTHFTEACYPFFRQVFHEFFSNDSDLIFREIVDVLISIHHRIRFENQAVHFAVFPYTDASAAHFHFRIVAGLFESLAVEPAGMSICRQHVRRSVRDNFVQRNLSWKRCVVPVCREPAESQDSLFVRMSIRIFFDHRNAFFFGSGSSHINHVITVCNCAPPQMVVTVNEARHDQLIFIFVHCSAFSHVLLSLFRADNACDFISFDQNRAADHVITATCKYCIAF